MVVGAGCGDSHPAGQLLRSPSLASSDGPVGPGFCGKGRCQSDRRWLEFRSPDPLHRNRHWRISRLSSIQQARHHLRGSAFADIYINGYTFFVAFIGEFIPAAAPNILFGILLTPLLYGAWKQAQLQSGR